MKTLSYYLNWTLASIYLFHLSNVFSKLICTQTCVCTVLHLPKHICVLWGKKEQMLGAELHYIHAQVLPSATDHNLPRYFIL